MGITAATEGAATLRPPLAGAFVKRGGTAQLTDVFQERIGIYRFDLTLKLRAIQTQLAAYEEDGE